MSKRRQVLIGMGLGLVWAFGVIWYPQTLKPPFMPINVALITGFLPGGLVLLLLIARLAQRRFFDEATIDGVGFAPGSGGDIDQRVLTNTVEQLLLAMALWPFVGLTLGGFLVVVMGGAFAVARLLFWAGYHLSPPLRAFGFAASFYPTVVAMVWAIAVWAV